MQQNRRVLQLVFALFLAIGFIMPWNPGHVLAAVACKGLGTSTLPSCEGKLPVVSMGCTATNAYDPNPITYNYAKIERRQSTDCNAKWTRVTNATSPSQSRYIAASSRYGCATYCNSQNTPSGGKVASGAQVYTPMVGLTGTPILSCGNTSSSVMLLPVGGGAPAYLGCKAW